MKTKAVGTLTPEQSQFLGGVLNSPLFADSPYREDLTNRYLSSESGELYPEDLTEDERKTIEYAIATSEQAQKMDIDATPDEIIAATPSPFPEEDLDDGSD